MIDYSEDLSVFNPKIEQLVSLIKNARKIAILTGAGVSTLSGIPDFRGNGGIYTKEFNQLSVEQILSIDFFYAHPEIFYKWASNVWYQLENYEPNVVHKLLAVMEQKGYVKEIFTQNIDMLHQKAGNKEVYEVHGSPMHNYCTNCHRHYSYEQVAPKASKGEVPLCETCKSVIKPEIVLYGEALHAYTLKKAEEVFSRQCDLCIVLGSSLLVGPVNQLPYMASMHNSKLVIVNAQETPLDGYADLIFKDLKQVSEALLKAL